MGDFNAEPTSLTYKEIIKAGFWSSHHEINKTEPPKTFPTGLQAPFMDTDPPLTVDFIFYRVGKGVHKKEKHIEVISSQRMGGTVDPKDSTIYGSDHYSVVSNFIIKAANRQ